MGPVYRYEKTSNLTIVCSKEVYTEGKMKKKMYLPSRDAIPRGLSCNMASPLTGIDLHASTSPAHPPAWLLLIYAQTRGGISQAGGVCWARGGMQLNASQRSHHYNSSFNPLAMLGLDESAAPLLPLDPGQSYGFPLHPHPTPQLLFSGRAVLEAPRDCEPGSRGPHCSALMGHLPAASANVWMVRGPQWPFSRPLIPVAAAIRRRLLPHPLIVAGG